MDSCYCSANQLSLKSFLIYFNCNHKEEGRLTLIHNDAIISLNRPGLAIDTHTRGNFVQYDFLKLHYIRNEMTNVSPLAMVAFASNPILPNLPSKQ